MTQSPPPVYLGLDVAKATLASHLLGAAEVFTNDRAGHRLLCQRILAQNGSVHVLCEATGGYERGVVKALRAAGVTVTVLQPARARQLAQGLGFLAKTDALDAEMLARLGPLLTPKPTPAPAPGVERLASLVTRREQLSELIRREKQHLETTTDRDLRLDIERNLAALEKRRSALEEKLTVHLQATPALAAKAERLRQAPGVGPVASATLLAWLPELGQGPAKGLASLAGLAPRNHDSGAFLGRRSVRGGRPKVRRMLYLCALSAARHHPTLRLFYLRLRAAGKAPKVALTALARKLLTFLHSSLKNPAFVLASF
jgi:transposase